MLESVIKKKYASNNVVELSESVQSSYVKFAEFINSAESQFANVSSELIEQISDFFEKVVMTRNHKYVLVHLKSCLLLSFWTLLIDPQFCISLFRILFSPPFTSDEEKDASIHKRIRQLNWINARHLVCSIDEANADVRDLVYYSINGRSSIYSMQLNWKHSPEFSVFPPHRIDFNGLLSVATREIGLHCPELS